MPDFHKRNKDKFVMICRGFARQDITCNWIGQYLKWYDPNVAAHETMAEWTPDIRQALLFDNAGEVMSMWRKVRTIDGGVREDGKPDRPLTAFTVEIRTIAQLTEA